jgi:hypothetical protein
MDGEIERTQGDGERESEERDCRCWVARGDGAWERGVVDSGPDVVVQRRASTQSSVSTTQREQQGSRRRRRMHEGREKGARRALCGVLCERGDVVGSMLEDSLTLDTTVVVRPFVWESRGGGRPREPALMQTRADAMHARWMSGSAAVRAMRSIRKVQASALLLSGNGAFGATVRPGPGKGALPSALCEHVKCAGTSGIASASDVGRAHVTDGDVPWLKKVL